MTSRAFDHVLIIMFENQYRGYVMDNPYFKNLAKQGIELTNSFGVMHPSQTNYISSIAGELCNVTDDNRPNPPLPQNTIVDLIEGSSENLDWRAYMDSYIANAAPWSSDNYQPQDRYPYMIKHNPFSSFANIIQNQQRWQKVDNEAGLFSDLLNGTLPNYAWFTPNMWNDGHYLDGTGEGLEGKHGSSNNGNRAPVLVDQQARWLESFFDKLGMPGPDSKLPANTLVVVTFDEADFEAFYETGDKYFYDGPNQIYTVLLGDMIQPGQQHEAYNHYSLLKTIEQNFNLGTLGKNDEHANWFRFLWGERFCWYHPEEIQWSGSNSEANHPIEMTSAAMNDLLYQFNLETNGNITLLTMDEWGTYSATQQPDILADLKANSVACAANEQQLILAVIDYEQTLHTFSYSLARGWQSMTLTASDIYLVDVTELLNGNEFMLVTQDATGSSQSYRLEKSAWQAAQAVPVCDSCEYFCLTCMGTSIFLIWQAQDRSLFAATYNTAEFNKTDVTASTYAGPYDNASINTWSGSAFRLTHYADSHLNSKANEPRVTESGYAAEGILQAAVLEGVLHLIHNACGTEQLVTETFSIPGLLTPTLPVSYDATKQTSTSNGYGTLAQAGWSNTQAIHHVIRSADGALSLSRFKQRLWLFYQQDEGAYRTTGEYIKE